MGILNKTKTYLIGPMQYQNGQEWREDMSRFLDAMGVVSFDPYKKPFLNAPKEDELTQRVMEMMMNDGHFEAVADHFKKIRSFDLSMVDRADFIICYLNPATPTFGTVEELAWSCRLKRPTFIVVEGGKRKTPLWVMGMFPHKYIYNSFDSLKKMLSDIDKGFKEIDSDRWRLLKDELR